jgi:outer membrane protein TolC
MPLHPALMVQDAKIDVARQQLRVDQAANLPTVKLNNEFAVSEDYSYFNGGPFHRRPTEFLSYITIDIPIWDFGQRHAGKLEAAEKVEYEKDLRRADQVTIQSAIAKIYGKAILDAKSIAEHQSKYFSAQQALLLAQAQRQQGSIDELALVSKETAAASEQVALEAATLLERIDYAELQNLSGGVWHWLQ